MKGQTQKAIYCILLVRHSGKSKTIGTENISGWGLGGILSGDRTVLDLDCGGGHTTVNIYQNLQNCMLRRFKTKPSISQSFHSIGENRE